MRTSWTVLALGLTAALAQTCGTGVYDCAYSSATVPLNSEGCAAYNGFYPEPQKLDGIMALASFFAMLMAFGIGANDAANSWATSVGSKAIGVTKAVLLCGFFEWAGATSLGYGVSKTIQKGVAKLTDDQCWACGTCHSEVTVAMGGSLGALIGASVFLMLASATAVPVSTTHAIVGGVVGMTVAGAGAGCLNWAINGGLGGIVLSWVISPLLSGIVASVGYYLGKRLIIKAKNPVQRVKRALPALFGICSFGLLMMLLLKAKAIKKRLSLPSKMILSAVIASIVGVISIFFMKRMMKDMPSELGTSHLYLRKMHDTNSKETEMSTIPEKVAGQLTPRGTRTDGGSVVDMKLTVALDSSEENLQKQFELSSDAEEEPCCEIPDAETPEQLDAIWAFRSILVFNACLESFAHGSNDTANATGPFSAVYQFYSQGRNACDSDAGSMWILSIAGLFVAIGVFTFGYRVIRTIGSNLTSLDYHKGFWIEFGSTTATMVATVLEFPVSTTHCQVGAVVGVGIITSYQGVGKVSWGLFSKIFLTWVLTLPISAGVSALVALAIKGSMVSVDSCPAPYISPFSG